MSGTPSQSNSSSGGGAAATPKRRGGIRATTMLGGLLGMIAGGVLGVYAVLKTPLLAAASDVVVRNMASESALTALFVGGALLTVVVSRHPFVTLAMIEGNAGRYDNISPRDLQQSLRGWGARAVAAHQNALEALPHFAVALIVAQLAGVPSDARARLGLWWLLNRAVFQYAYVADRAGLRSFVYIQAFAVDAALLVLSMYKW